MASSMTTSSSSSKGRTSHLELSMGLLEALEKGGLLSGSLEEATTYLTEAKFAPFKAKGASKAASAYGLWQKDQTFEKGTTTAGRSALWKMVSEEDRADYQELADAKNAVEGKEVVKKVSKGTSTTGWTLHQREMKASGQFTRAEISAAWASKTEAEKAVMNAAAHKSNLEKSLELAKELEAPKTLPPVKVPAKLKKPKDEKPKDEKPKAEKPKKPKKSKAEKAAEKKAAEEAERLAAEEAERLAAEEAERLAQKAAEAQDSGEESSDGEEEEEEEDEEH